MGCVESAGMAQAVEKEHMRDDCNLDDQLVEHSEMLQLVIKDSWISAGGDSVSIFKADGSEFLRVKGTSLGLCNRLVFLGTNGNPVAVCMMQPVHLGFGAFGPSVYVLGHGFDIFSFKPRVKGQVSSGKEHDGFPLYSWATAKAGMIHSNSFTLRMATGDNAFDGTSYTAEPVGGLAHDHTVKKGGIRCCNIERGWSEHGALDSYRLTVAANIDPVLMTCFSVMMHLLHSCDEGL